MAENKSNTQFPDDGDQPSTYRAAIGKAVAQRLDANPMVSPVGDERLQIYARHNFLTDEECATLCAILDAGCEPSTLFSGSEGPHYRTSHSCNLDRYDPLVTTIAQRLCALTGLDISHGETLQGQRYTKGQEYKAHCDWFPVTTHFWPDMRDSGGQRTWTAMLYLNDVEAGGETQFLHCGFMVPPRKGMALVWNNMKPDGAPNIFSLHAARPVLAGSKYVMTKWFRERPWIT